MPIAQSMSNCSPLHPCGLKITSFVIYYVRQLNAAAASTGNGLGIAPNPLADALVVGVFFTLLMACGRFIVPREAKASLEL